MNCCLLALFLLFLCTQHTLSKPWRRRFKCDLEPNYSNPKKFLQMHAGGFMHEHTCPGGLVFDRVNCVCDRPNRCENRPSPKGLQFFEQRLQGNKYITRECGPQSGYNHEDCLCSIHLGN